MSITFTHKELGDVEGNTRDSAVEFLGIKYASLENRFATPELVTSYGAGTLDATKFGPPPVSPIGAINNEFGFIQHSLPLPDVPGHSDIEGLNLNITVPTSKDGTVDVGAKLPVYVFVHGGGFAVGSSWYPHYDPAPLVKLSVEKGKPIIGVTINYRLGVAGFLTSKELRDAGFRANNGFLDLRTALKWVRQFIDGFGGDADEITTVGESAGGLAVTMLLASKEPLMKRCLSTGGAILLFKPLPDFLAEGTYQKIIEAFGLADKSPKDRIQTLLTMPIDDLWQKIPPGMLLAPSIDNDLVPGVPDFPLISSQSDDPRFTLPGRKWCSALMMGASNLDANILYYTGLNTKLPNLAPQFISSVHKTLHAHPKAATHLLSSYDIHPDTPDDPALLAILRFGSEVSFYAPCLAFAKGWPNTPDNKFFLYRFNEGIPWEGKFKGWAGHILDVAYLFQNYNAYLSEGEREVARGYGEDFIEFVNGGEPWTPVQGDKLGVRVYGPSGEGVTRKFVADGRAREVGGEECIQELGEEVGWDLLMEVFQNFVFGL